MMPATTAWGQKEIIRTALESDFVPMAPPCGTASNSREKRMSWGPGPKPLRSDSEPHGLSTLRGKDLDRVRSANILYKFVAELVEVLDERGISWSVANPRNSYMWQTTWFKKVV